MQGAPIIIIGAGISGLVLAQALKSRSVPFRVYERDASLTARDQGYRFRISDEAIDALKECLRPETYEQVERTTAYVKPGSSTAPPVQIDAMTGEPMASRFGKGTPNPNPLERKQTLSVDRTALRAVLLEGIEHSVEFGKAFERYEETPKGVLVRFQDGSTASGSLVIAADGSRSHVRHQLLPEFRLLDTGARLIYGKTVLSPELRREMSQYVKEDLSLYLDLPHHLFGGAETMAFSKTEDKVPKDYVYWFFFVPDALVPKDRYLSSDETVALARSTTAHWDAGWRALQDAKHHPQARLVRVPTTHPDHLPSYDMKAKVILMGDAAHAMATTSSLGATTAIRDAGAIMEALMANRKDDGGLVVESARSEYEENMRVYAAQALWKTQMGGKMVMGMKGFGELEPMAEG
ncbi:cercosporin toxin biosynthesis protein [Teratosphaeria destructans]|uniref:Cercosporin toxin biosynthesis protein n=1 Tax=Teratosphaeria destructans TaxID=418781 RepID=A0A9W7VZ43_9PEZI|nr:cercosporin toxin biosynthesis protein [Teratosphaeria destructans]